MVFDPTFIWAIFLAAAVFMYVVMDGFDLGIGILFPFFPHKDNRDIMVNTIAPFWDGNETWLVLGGGGLLAAFPMAYAILMPALYMPVIMMLLALVFRGVSFEMRFKAETSRHQLLWDIAFSGGSYVASLCQGLILGALVQGIKVANNAYAGGWWDWLTPFSLFTGLAVLCGYALLGACWIIWKTEDTLQYKALDIARVLGFVMLGFMISVSAIMPFLQSTFLQHWLTMPYSLLALPMPLIVGLIVVLFLKALAHIKDRILKESHPNLRNLKGDAAPFLYALCLFSLSYIGLGISMWPYIIPPTITLYQAAASPSSQRFLLIGAVILVPIILSYTAYMYWLFRGKITKDTGYH